MLFLQSRHDYGPESLDILGVGLRVDNTVFLQVLDLFSRSL